MEHVGRLLIVSGVVLAILGVLIVFGSRLPFRIGRLPLDFHFKRGNIEFYFPLGTTILASIVLTLIFTLLRKR
jgi:membrane associated rhomboid family serine protease